MIVYRYGARPPTNAKLVDEQLWLAHRYRNKLTEIERTRRADVAAIPTGVMPEQRIVGNTWANEVAAHRQREARAVCGVYWGSYLLVEAANDAARKSRTEPHFHRWDGTGQAGVQLQGGLAVADAMSGTDTRLRITQMPDSLGMIPNSRRAGRRFVVSLRIGSNGRNPIWADFPTTLHRPLPETGTIKWAWAQRKRVGPDFRWSICFTVDTGDAIQMCDANADRNAIVALDLGWRARPDGFRIAYWLDSLGQHDEIVLPEQDLEDHKHIRSIGASRRRAYDEFLPVVRDWVELHRTELPEWFAKTTETISYWKSPDRLAGLAWRWKHERFPGDEEIFESVGAWRKKDRHLHQWHAHGLANILARRDELYRRLAAHLAKHYRVIVIEKFDLRAVAGRRGLSKKPTDAEKVIADNASSRRHMIAPGTFRLAVLNASRARGTEIVAVPAEWTTIDCASCGCREKWDAAPAIDHRCTSCGDTWDQDHQACVNLLARYNASTDMPRSPQGALAEGKSARQQRFLRRRRASVAEAGSRSQIPIL